MPRPLSLPRSVSLRASRGRGVPVGTVYDALNLSRQRAYALRQVHGFPASDDGMIDPQAVGAWLIGRGVTVNFV